MANWWDSAPLAEPVKAQSQSGNWWDAAPIAKNEPVSDIERAKAELAKGLREGKSGDMDTYRAASFRTNQGARPANATDAAVNGMTAGFSDEISAALRAPIDMLLRGEGYNEAYQHNLSAERDRLEQYRKNNPALAASSELAGSLAFPFSKAAGAIKSGVASGMVFGAGNSEGDLSQRASDAAVGGVLSGALGAAMSGAGRIIGGKAPSPTPSIGELKEAARQGYKSPAIKELELDPKAVSNAVTGIRARLDAEGLDEIIGPKAHAILKRIGSVPDDAIMTGQNLHSLQKTLGKAAKSIDPQERNTAKMALNEFNDFLENIPAQFVKRGNVDDFVNTMREANANYARAMQSGNIDQKIIQAETRAASANSGMNVANTIRQRMADVKLNPKLNRGMHADDIAAAGQIAEGTKTQNLIRKIGNIAGGGGGMGSLVAGAIGSGAAYAGDSNPALGLALPAFGMAMRGVGNRMTLNQAHKLSEAIRSRAPLASATNKFEEKVAQFFADRNSKNAAAASIAARNLSSNLRAVGFDISACDLMNSLRGPYPGRADDEIEVQRPPGQ